MTRDIGGRRLSVAVTVASYVAPFAVLLAAWLLLAVASNAIVSPGSAVLGAHEWLSEPTVRFGTSVTGWDALAATFGTAIVCCLIGIPLGVAAGLVLGLNRYLRSVYEPIVVSIQGIPKTILYPVLFAVLGVGWWLYGTLAIINVFIVMLLSVMAGAATMNPSLVEMGKVFRLSPQERIRKIYLPALALPIMVGIRLAFSVSLLMVTLTEMIVARVGVGSSVTTAYNVGRQDVLFGAVLVVFVLAMIVVVLLRGVEKAVERRLGMRWDRAAAAA